MRTVVSGELRLADYEAWFEQHQAAIEECGRWVHLVDVRGVTNLPGAALRDRIAHDSKSSSDTHPIPIAMAYTVATPLLRAAVTGVHWLIPQLFPVKVFAEDRDAVEWANWQLVRAGVERTEGLVAYLRDLGIS